MDKAAPNKNRRSPVVVEYEPRARVYVGWTLVGLGAVGLVPLNMDWYEILQPFLLAVLVLGIAVLLSGFQSIGWRLELVSNILYYQKFNLYMSWKQRRSKEYTINTTNIDKVVVGPKVVSIQYNGNKQLSFTSYWTSSARMRKLNDLAKRIHQES